MVNGIMVRVVSMGMVTESMVTGMVMDSMVMMTDSPMMMVTESPVVMMTHNGCNELLHVCVCGCITWKRVNTNDCTMCTCLCGEMQTLLHCQKAQVYRSPCSVLKVIRTTVYRHSGFISLEL